jgi:MHS family shikimate/dehydroshikimate transporter-like MFS transporter
MNAELVIRDATIERKGGMTSVVFAGSIGTVIEWYDFLIYGTAAALVFNTLFFPTIDPLSGTLASLATYSVGFVARPIGGAIFGHFGDRIGRKAMLMITMAIMALGTFAVGCLPTYQQIGVWAPIFWSPCGSSRASRWAANGVARRSWLSSMRRQVGAVCSVAWCRSASRSGW